MDGNLKAEADASNNITATYIRGGNRLLIKQLADGTQYYYLYNGHGDVVQITDNAGNIVNSYEYDEWGNITSQTETIENDFKYAGQTYDSETGLYYLRARYYDPETGRFIFKDSNEGSIVNPLSLNLYTYCYNNPLIYIDPSGHYVVCDWLNNINDKYIGGPLNDLNDQYIGGPLNQAADGDWEGVLNTGEGIVKFVLFDWDDPNAVDIIGIAFKPAKGVKPAGKIISKGAGKTGKIEYHHLLPQQFKDKFEKVGLDIEQYKMPMDKADHRLKPKGLHTSDNNWNSQWKNFFDDNPKASKPDILNQLDKMKKDFGLK